MLRLFSLFLFLHCSLSLQSQCLTDFQKLIPDKYISTSNRFGKSVAINGNYAAVGAPNSDSLAHFGGIVYMYKKELDNWNLIALFHSSDIETNDFFGDQIELSENFLFVSSRKKSKVYVFEKNNEWVTSTEDFVLKSPEDHTSFGSNIHMRHDENKLIIANSQLRAGVVYIYSRPALGWASSADFITLEPPDDNNSARSQSFGLEIDYEEDMFVVGAPEYGSGRGISYLYESEFEDWSNFELKARLSPSYPSGLAPGFGSNIEILNGNIFITNGAKYYGLSSDAFFVFRNRNDWSDAIADEAIQIVDSTVYIKNQVLFAYEDKLVCIGSGENLGSAFIYDVSPDGNVNKLDSIGIYPNAARLTSQVAVGFDMDERGQIIVGNPWDPELDRLRGSASIFEFSNSNWDFHKNNKLTYDSHNASDSYYGNSLVSIEDHLFVGVPYDHSNNSIFGKVNIYSLSDGGWNKVKQLTGHGDGNKDDFFGSSIDIYDNYLAVGASGHEPYGAIVLYQKESSWSDLTYIETIVPPDSLGFDLIGTNVRFDNGLLVASGKRKNNSGSNQILTIAIWGIENSHWVFQDYIDIPSFNILEFGLTPSISVHKNTIVIGSRESKILERNLLTQKWEEKATLVQHNKQSFDLFGIETSMTENHIFISAPKYDTINQDVGAVFVFTKPVNGWNGQIEESSIIIPQNGKKYGVFGASISAIENTLVVGAPIIDNNALAPELINFPGSAYVFQTSDYFWHQSKQLLKVQGDLNTQKDVYGWKVHAGLNQFFVSALKDDNKSGFRSGAVYSTTMPPVIKTIPPICLNQGPIELFGYPYEGIWSGLGIINSLTGTFDPSIAGIGKHKLHYDTPNCSEIGTLEVEVLPPLEVVLTNEKVIEKCLEDKIQLGVNTFQGAQYEWFYSNNLDRPFGSTFQFVNNISTGKNGFYYVRVSNNECAINSDIIEIRSFSKEKAIIFQTSTICENREPVSLNSSIEGGLWFGENVFDKTQGLFDPSNLSNGSYEIEYHYPDINNCLDTAFTEIKVAYFEPPVINNINQNICLEDVTLEIQDFNSMLVYELVLPDDNIVELKNNIYKVEFPGEYYVSASNGYCTKISNVKPIVNNLEIDLLPSLDNYQECEKDFMEIFTTFDKEGFMYDWYFQENEESSQSIISQPHQHNFTVLKSGYYQLNVYNDYCTATTKKIKVDLIKPKEFTVANVFTPNNDQINEEFRIPIENTQFYQFSILNRYGKNVFSTTDQQIGWSGLNATSGVYYWTLAYQHECEENNRKVLTGTVTLMR